MSLFRTSDYTPKKNEKVVMKKTKIPGTMKSHPKFCRTCNCKNNSTAMICTQCGGIAFMKKAYK